MKMIHSIKNDFTEAEKQYSIFLLTYLRFLNNMLHRFESQSITGHEAMEIQLRSSLHFTHLLHSHTVSKEISLAPYFTVSLESATQEALGSAIRELRFSLSHFPFSSKRIRESCLGTMKQFKNYYAPDTIKIIIPASSASLPWLVLQKQ